jgi:hypothetical protein
MRPHVNKKFPQHKKPDFPMIALEHFEIGAFRLVKNEDDSAIP